jgi:hypothetical protein
LKPQLDTKIFPMGNSASQQNERLTEVGKEKQEI